MLLCIWLLGLSIKDVAMVTEFKMADALAVYQVPEWKVINVEDPFMFRTWNLLLGFLERI